MSAVRYVFYAEQEADGSWRPFLQMAHAEGDEAGNIFWMDPGKTTFKTEAEALEAARKLETYGEKADVDMKLFEAAASTDLRLGKIEIAVKCGAATCEAFAVEKARVDAEIEKLAPVEEKPIEEEPKPVEDEKI